MSYNSEQSFVDEVEQCLKDNGCQTWREVVPDQCEGWDMPYRVDLIFYRDDFGYVGVEAKNTNTLGAGARIYNAIKQIDEKYRNKTYFKGNLIERWTLLMPNESEKERVVIFLRGFLSQMNIHLVEYTAESKWKKSRIVVSAFTQRRIEIGGQSKYNG